jgi:LacI family transcriptional regulator
VTLKDIAESVGVNASTVSRALDPAKAHLVNEATVARVREAAKDLGYRGDHVAGSLRRRATATVGVIVGDLANPFIAPVIHGIANALAAELMLPLIFETQDDGTRLEWGVNHLLSRRVDAIIVAGARFGDRHALEAAARFTPVVVAVRGLPGSPLPHVLHDDRAGGAMAARHLIDLGHTRLAELRGPMDIGNFVARHEGFRDACHDANVELVDGLGFGSTPNREEGERLANDLLGRHGRSLPTAVFAHNDLMALGALSVFRGNGLVCPHDVSLVGYNNSPTIDQVDPPLTSVAYPGTEVGLAAGSLALQLIARTDRLTPGALFQPTILVRESTAPPAASRSAIVDMTARTRRVDSRVGPPQA